MNIEVIKKNIERKIRAREDLTDEEIDLMLPDNNLLNVQVESMIEENYNWRQYDADMFNKVFEYSNLISNDKMQQLLIKYFKYALYSGDIDMARSLIDLLQEADKYQEMLENYIADPNSKIEVTSESVHLLIKYKRYDALEDVYYTRNNAATFVAEIEKNNIDIDSLPIKLKALYQKFKYFSDVSYFLGYSDSNIYSNEQAMIVVNGLENKNILNAAFDSIHWWNVIHYLALEENEMMFSLILERKMVSVYLEFAPVEDVLANIDIIADNLSSDSQDFISNISLSNRKELLNNSKLVEALFNTRKYDLVLESIYSDLYIDKIVDKIKANEVKVNNFKKIFSNKKIVEAFLENGYENQIAAAINNQTYHNMKEASNEVLECLAKYSLNNDSFPFSELFIKVDNNIINELVKTGSFKKVIDINTLALFNNISTESLDSMLDYLKVNINLSNRFIENHSFNIFGVNFPLYDNILVKKVIEFYANASIEEFDSLLLGIIHNENNDRIFTSELFSLLRTNLSRKYNVSEEKLQKLHDKFGSKIICHIENTTIKAILDLSDEELNKFLDLFVDTKFSMDDLSSIYDSVRQQEYYLNNQEVIEIFPNIMHSINDGTDDYLDLINTIYNSLDDKVIKKFNKIFSNISCNNMEDIKNIFDSIIRDIKSSDYEVKTRGIELLHFFSSYYIAIKREEYRRDNYHLEQDLNLPYHYDKKEQLDYALKYIIKERKDKLIEMLATRNIDSSLALALINTYNKENITMDIDPILVKKNMKYLIMAAKEYMTSLSKEELENIIDNIPKTNLKRVYEVDESIFSFQLLEQMRISTIRSTLLAPGCEREYAKAKEMMAKYKLHVMPESLKEYLQDKNILTDYNNLSAIITYYSKILSEEQARLASMKQEMKTNVLPLNSLFKYAEVLASTSSVYSQVLTPDDAQLIKRNPGPNSATDKVQGDERLEESVNMTLKNYQRQSVTIPPFKNTYNIGNKKMSVTVGNFTDPSILSLGERTGACMRIGGPGESLYYFCLDNPNGFHILFTDPKTGKFISRVSGFRNGNTVFLNELRNSCIPDEYSDSDIVEVCRMVSEELISRSKDSTCPICNVVCHNAYALSDIDKYPPTALNIANNKVGLPNFYSDVSTYEYIFATTSRNVLTPIVFSTDTNVPTYEPVRESVREFKNIEQANNQIQRVGSVKKLMSGYSIQTLELIPIKGEEIYGFSGQDWYLYTNENGEIIEENIGVDKRAEKEIEKAREIVERYIVQRKENEYAK